MSAALSQAMRIGLQYMEAAAAAGREPHAVMHNTLDAPYIADGQVIMDWRTAEALERRGLVRCDEGDVWLREQEQKP